MDIKLLTSLYRAIQQTPVKHVTLEGRGLTISMTRGSEPIQKPFESPPLELKSSSTIAPPSASKEELPAKKDKDICADQVGTFTRFDQKTKKQYVKLRDIISEGDIVGCIQSLGVSHEVAAKVHGKIVHFLVEEGQPVEYGQPLVRLE